MNDIIIELEPIDALKKLKHSELFCYPSIVVAIKNATGMKLEIKHTFLVINGLDKPLPIGNFFSNIKDKNMITIGGVLGLAEYLNNNKSIVFNSDIISLSLQIEIETNMGTFLSNVLDMKED